MTQYNISRRGSLKAIGAAGTAMVAGCLGDDDEEIELVGHTNPGENTIYGLGLQWFADYIEDETDGEVQFELHFDSALGGLVESIEQLSAGTIDVIPTVPALMGILFDDMQVFNVPYAFDDIEECQRAVDPRFSDLAQQISDSLVEETDIRVIGSAMAVGARHTSVSDEPVYAPEDLEGRDLRAPPLGIYFETLRGLGANPVDIDYAELPTALATGEVEGQENPYNLIWEDGLYEEQDYVIETAHMYEPLPMNVNEDTWQSLTDDQQEIFNDALDHVFPIANEHVREQEAEYKDLILDAGLEIIEHDEIDVAAFQDRVRSHMNDEFPDWADWFAELAGEEYV